MPGPQKKDFEKIYQNPLWQTQAKEFEQSFARRLYDDTQVRSAGRVALSKMSRLLVRYNRLQKADEEGADFASYKYAKEMQRHMAALDRIKNRKEEGLEKFTEENSKEREDFLKKIEDEQNEEEKGHKVELANIEKMKNAGKKMSLNTQLDNDRNGRIRSRLLLGGNAQGARDFSLTEGDEIEQRIAGNYISDISGENGNLFDQMSLFDNAVNSKGIEDEEGPELKSFNEIMTGMTEKDLEQMNSGKDDEKVEVDINALNEARKNNNLSELIGDGGEKKNIEEALESRGSQKAVKRAQRFKKAAINKIKADYNAGINRQRTASGRGLFGKLGRAFSVKEKRYKGFTDVFGRSYSREDARRIDMRRKSLEYRLMIAKTRTEKKDYSKVSDEDTSARLDERLKDIHTVKPETGTGARGGLLTTRVQGEEDPAKGRGEAPEEEKEKENEGKGVNADKAEEEAKNGGDKAVRNMLNAYRLLGASMPELLKLRLALIAYMVPSGRKTIYEVLKEAQEAGVTDGENLTDAGEMYAGLSDSVEKLLGVRYAESDDEKAAKIQQEEMLLAEKAKTAEKRRREQDELAGMTFGGGFKLNINDYRKKPVAEKAVVKKEKTPGILRYPMDIVFELIGGEQAVKADEAGNAAENKAPQNANEANENEGLIVNDNNKAAEEEKLEGEKQIIADRAEDLEQKIDAKGNENADGQAELIELEKDDENIKQAGEIIEKAEDLVKKADNGKIPPKEIELAEMNDEEEKENGADLEEADKSARATENINIVPVGRTKAGLGVRIKNRLKGVLAGVLGVLSAPIGFIALGITKIKQVRNRGRNLAGAQEKRRGKRQELLGMDVRTLAEKEQDPGRDTENEVFENNANIPIVWERTSPDDPEKKPEISLVVQKASESGDASTNKLEMGHSMVGLSYTRLNKLTGKKERYKLQYGFYPSGGFFSQSGQITALNGAVIPGTLVDDTGHAFSISKTYEIDNKKVNDVLKDSETYADKGYNYYNRNCTTFMVEMAKTAGLPIASEFKETEMNFGKLVDAGMVVSGGIGYAVNASALENFESKLQRKDLSFERYGQKMATLEDLESYKKSNSFLPEMIHYGFSPQQIGNQLEQTEDEGVTMIPEYKGFFDKQDYYDAGSDYEKIEINEAGDSVGESITALLTLIETPMMHSVNRLEEVEGAKQEKDPRDVELGNKLLEFTNANNIVDLGDKTEHNRLRELYKAYTELRQLCIDERVRHKGEEAFTAPLTKIIISSEEVLTHIERTYDMQSRTSVQGDLNKYSASFANEKQDYVYFIPDENDPTKQKKGTKLIDASATPEMYEGYLLLFGSAPDAIKQISVLNGYEKQMDKLSSQVSQLEEEKKNASEDENGEDKNKIKELSKQISEKNAQIKEIKKNREYSDALRINTTVRQIVATRRARFDKNNITREELKYAFTDLPELEAKGITVTENIKANEEYYSRFSPSKMSQAVIFSSVFEGTDPIIGKLNNDAEPQDMAQQVSEGLADIAGKADRREKLKAIISYLSTSKEEFNSADAVWNYLIKSLCDGYLYGIMILKYENNEATEIFYFLMKDDSPLKRMIFSLFEEIRKSKQ